MNLLNHLQDDEAVLFGDAVPPAHAAHAVGCWAPRGVAVAGAQTTGRDHLNPIERLWGPMHKHVTHTESYPTFRAFRGAIRRFLRRDVTHHWDDFCDSVSDDFRVIGPTDYRTIG